MPARTPESCTPENRFCGGGGEVGPALIAQLTDCGVECRGGLAELLINNGRCGMPGATVEEIARRLARAGVTHGFDLAFSLADEVLAGNLRAAPVLADPSLFLASENPVEGRLYVDPC